MVSGQILLYPQEILPRVPAEISTPHPDFDRDGFDRLPEKGLPDESDWATLG